MILRAFALAVAALATTVAVAQYQPAPRQKVEKAADLPRFSYKIDGKV